MNISRFCGNPSVIGRSYGERFAAEIKKNLSILVWREGYEPLPLADRHFQQWMARQEKILNSRHPELLEEFHGIAAGAGCKYEDVLLYNLRCWQYAYYHGRFDLTACSNIVVQLAGGKWALAGALDDAIEYYCGLVEWQPEKGHGFVTLPFSGHSGSSRGLNTAGLAIGISSLIVENVPMGPNQLNQDLVIRLILQNCATVAEVEALCREYSFIINLAALDASGNSLMQHCIGSEQFVIAHNAAGVVTNHLTCDRLFSHLTANGCRLITESPTTRPRRGKLLDFVDRHNGRCTSDQVKTIMADRDNGAVASICPSCNVAVTCCVPQIEPRTFWWSEPSISGKEEWSAYQLNHT